MDRYVYASWRNFVFVLIVALNSIRSCLALGHLHLRLLWAIYTLHLRLLWAIYTFDSELPIKSRSIKEIHMKSIVKSIFRHKSATIAAIGLTAITAIAHADAFVVNGDLSNCSSLEYLLNSVPTILNSR